MIRKKRHNHGKTNAVEVPKNRINEEISSNRIQLVGDNVDNKIYSFAEAIKLADDENLDLVEMTVNREGIAVCKIIDYNKFLFEKKKKGKEVKAKNKITEVKEIRLTPNTDEHDFAFKAKHAENFLKEGHKVKVMLQFKGRSIIYKDRGIEMINKLVDSLKEYGTVEEKISEDRRRMNTVIAPKNKK